MPIHYSPYPYQQKAIEFIETHPKCLLSLGMGLGKTSITLYAIRNLLNDFAINRVLIIAPLYVAKDTWPREVKKWDFSKDLSISVAVGTPAQRRKAIESDSVIVVINKENVLWLLQNYGKHFSSLFDMIVIDESSAFKSFSSKRFKALRKKTAEVSRVVELTGTPRPRSIEDLYPQLFLLDSGERLGKSMTAFRTRYEKPGRRGPNNVVFNWIPLDGAEDSIYNAISDISMSMSAEDYLSVPEEQIIDHRFDLPKDAEKEYRKLEKESILSVKPSDIVGGNAGVLAGKLLQFANGAVYDEEGGVHVFHDEKLKILEEIMESTEDPVMVFFWYKHDYERLKNYFASYHPVRLKTTTDIERWNAGKIRMALVHPASMGHGLNLQDGGHIIVWFGLTWSLEITQQANARLHRQGQKQKVQIHRIIANDTVDEDVIKSLDRKDSGQNNMLEAIKARIDKHMEV